MKETSPHQNAEVIQGAEGFPGFAMIVASQLRPGMVVKLGEDLLKVVESTFHVRQAKMPGSIHTKVRNEDALA